MERDAGAATGSPFKRGTTLNQQIEIAKLNTATAIEERKSLDQEFGTEMHNLQQEIENRIELAKLWQVTDRSDPLFKEIKDLMDRKRELSLSFKTDQGRLNEKRQKNEEMMQQAFLPSRSNRRVTAATTGASLDGGGTTASTTGASPDSGGMAMSLSITSIQTTESCLTDG